MKTKKHGRTTGVGPRSRHRSTPASRARTLTPEVVKEREARAFQRGVDRGSTTSKQEEAEFLQMLLTKRNAKDIKGLIEKRLTGR